MLTEYPDLLTAAQVAKILGITRQRVYRMVDEGYFYGVKLGRSYRISKLRLIDYLIGDVA